MEETTSKLEILGLLNAEFFEDLRVRRDENTLVNYFGPQLGRHLWRHALIEESFQTLTAEGEAVGEDGSIAGTSEEMLRTQQTLQKSTQILIRQFSKTENRYKL